MEGQFTLTKFKGLTAADQSAVRAQKKMDDYLKGLLLICEVRVIPSLLFIDPDYIRLSLTKY